MQPLKLLVIVMSAAIVVGLAVVVVTAIERMGGRGAGAAGFGAASVVLPQGCHVIGMSSAGSKLALRLGDGPDCQIVLLVDPESGRQTGRIGLLVQP